MINSTNSNGAEIAQATQPPTLNPLFWKVRPSANIAETVQAFQW